MAKIEERNDALKRNKQIPLQRYRFAIKCLKETGKKKVIDVGTGFGYGAHMLREAGHDVLGIDNSKEAIDYAKKNYLGKYKVMDVEKEKLPPSKAVVCLETLCHLKNPQKFIDKIKAEELVISAPINPDPNDGYKYRLHNLSEEQFMEMLDDWYIMSEIRQRGYLSLYCLKK